MRFLNLSEPRISKSDIKIVNEQLKKNHLAIGKNISKFETDLKKYLGDDKEVISVSAITGKGVESLRTKIANKYSSLRVNGSLPLITTLRQKNSLTETLSFIKASLEMLKQKSPPLEILAHELTMAINQLDITTGKTTTNDILDSVFSSFCVGK